MFNNTDWTVWGPSVWHISMHSIEIFKALSQPQAGVRLGLISSPRAGHVNIDQPVVLWLSSNLSVTEENLALLRPTTQSDILWSYGPDLAVDGDPNTCSFTTRQEGQRWWQVRDRDAPPSTWNIILKISFCVCLCISRKLSTQFSSISWVHMEGFCQNLE